LKVQKIKRLGIRKKSINPAPTKESEVLVHVGQENVNRNFKRRR